MVGLGQRSVEVGDAGGRGDRSHRIPRRAVVLTEQGDDAVFLDQSLRGAHARSGNAGLVGDLEGDEVTVDAAVGVDLVDGDLPADAELRQRDHPALVVHVSDSDRRRIG
jgi:hypothetical protein